MGKTSTDSPTERRARNEDLEAMYALHVAALAEYVTLTHGWDGETQARMFRGAWPERVADLRIIEIGGEIAGAYRIERTLDGVYLALIEIAPAHQGRGIGTGVVVGVLERARRSAQKVRLSVMKANPRARAFYERLGFCVTGETATHHEMIAG